MQYNIYTRVFGSTIPFVLWGSGYMLWIIHLYILSILFILFKKSDGVTWNFHFQGLGPAHLQYNQSGSSTWGMGRMWGILYINEAKGSFATDFTGMKIWPLFHSSAPWKFTKFCCTLAVCGVERADDFMAIRIYQVFHHKERGPGAVEVIPVPCPLIPHIQLLRRVSPHRLAAQAVSDDMIRSFIRKQNLGLFCCTDYEFLALSFLTPYGHSSD